MNTQRLDKWLWAARFFKTRSLAVEAVSGGKVHVDGQRVKPARAIHPGCVIRVRKNNFEMTVEVVALSKQRGPAPVARELYRETMESLQRREEEKLRQRADVDQGRRRPGKPSKRDRRQIHRFRTERTDT